MLQRTKFSDPITYGVIGKNYIFNKLVKENMKKIYVI
jgi:hypothetical protein